MKVWIDQELCTGAAMCEDEVPDVFHMADDGLAYVKEDGSVLDEPGGEGSKATVPAEHEEAVREMVGDCPGECIFVEE
jgi:ferredoxin